MAGFGEVNKVGFVGMGKLGLMVALAIESKGYEVCGTDINPDVESYIKDRQIPYQEIGASTLLATTNLEFLPSISEVVAQSDLVFCPIQTPHEPEFEGTTRLGEERKDFDYSYLVGAIKEIAEAAKEQKKPTNLVVISTCLPGTYSREIAPIIEGNEYINYLYEPLYIAMGTVIPDYLDPEFVLVGHDNMDAAIDLGRFYQKIHHKPIFETDITTAEGIKVFYNTMITMKTILANAWMQTAHKTGMNVDDITEAMSLATDRLLSPKYLRGGSPDSGGCHPRDLIALSWLGDQVDLQPNVFEEMAKMREEQTAWTASLVAEKHKETGLPVYVLGKAFKPETNLTVGSGATLLVNMLKEQDIEAVQYDPKVDETPPEFKPGVYFVATDHEEFKYFNFPKGSVVYDLWRSLPDIEGVEVIHIGK